ncbi:MAG: hypothetical protein KAJ32_09560 [Gammaproteobacteria bacterium]|nr:hypothetical protein [Gammaproteobacteria bacterium]
MDREKLEAASEQGIITKDQVESLLDFFDDENGASSGKNAEEQLRFVRSFGDIFITLGIIFVTVAGSKLDIDPYLNLIPIILLIGTTEWLVRVRRLALPGIALLVATLYFASQLISFSESWHDLPNLIFYTALALLFYIRYKMPFALMPIAAGSIGIVSMLIGADIFEYQYTFAIYGLLVFFTAMWFDSRDRERRNRLSDSAFWLHLLAAPLVVHGVMANLLTSTDSPLPTEILIIAFFVTFFLIALYVDRRALLVSSLSYAIYAVISLSKVYEANIENVTLMLFIVFGVFIVLFGAYWYRVRSMIFSKTSHMWLSNYVPPF